MKQAILTVVIILVSVGLLTAVILGSRNSSEPARNGNEVLSEDSVQTTEADIYYWGTTCPFCDDVSDWMEENSIEEKMTIISKEVYENTQNAMELQLRARACGLDQRNIGVPFMYTTEGQCLIGSFEIIDYLSEKVGLVEEIEDETEEETL